MKLKFLYHGGAMGACGYITLPLQETMPVQASLSVPINGGHGEAHVERYSHRSYLSFERATSAVVGSYSESDDAYGTLATTTIEGLNIMGVVTCDRIVARITSKHPADGSEPSFIPIGSHFDNLRIAGLPIQVKMATDLFTEHHTWTRLAKAHASKKADRDRLNRLRTNKATKFPACGETMACTLAEVESLPGGLTRKGQAIHVPHFGTVNLGQYFANAHMHRLLMLHVDLGCSVEGCYGAGGSDGNGTPPPSS